VARKKRKIEAVSQYRVGLRQASVVYALMGVVTQVK